MRKWIRCNNMLDRQAEERLTRKKMDYSGQGGTNERVREVRPGGTGLGADQGNR